MTDSSKTILSHKISAHDDEGSGTKPASSTSLFGAYNVTNLRISSSENLTRGINRYRSKRSDKMLIFE